MLQNEMKNEHLDTSLINTSNSSTNSNSSSCVSSSSSMNFNNANGQQQQFNMVNCLNAKNNNDINNNSAIMLNNNTNNTPNGMIRSTSNTSLCGDHDISANFDDFSSQTNLIVNYLPQNMTQDEIKSLFANIGPVESCKLIKDKLSDIADGQSLGYAFVNYAKQEDAQKAIDSLNGMRLQNKTIKVSLARPSSESIKGANLYVCGLHKDFTQTELENMFTPFGTIISSKILTDPKTGASKGVGFVRFDQRNEAEIAIGKLNGSTLDSSPEPLVVKFANSPTSAKTVMGLPLAPFVPTVRGFYQPYRSSTNASYRYSPMGYCPETSLLQQHQAPPSHLTGMLPAQPHQQQQLHQQQSNTSLSNSLNCSIGALTPSLATLVPAINSGPPTSSLSNSSISSSNYSGWCIFVYNLGPETDEGILWQLFGPFGAVQSVKIIRDAQTQKCKGFGFVTMTNYDEAVLAINCLNGFNLQNRILQVSFKTNHKQIF